MMYWPLWMEYAEIMPGEIRYIAMQNQKTVTAYLKNKLLLFDYVRLYFVSA